MTIKDDSQIKALTSKSGCFIPSVKNMLLKELMREY